MVSRRLTSLRRRPAARAPGRGIWRRAPRNSGTGRTRRRRATAAPPAAGRPSFGIARRSFDGPFERDDDLVLDLSGKRRGKFLGRLADQIGLADAREKAASARRCRRSSALPPAIQKMSSKQASARAAASALVALESLTNSTAPLRPTCSMRWASPGNERSPRWIACASRPSASAAPVAQAAFCALCRSAQRIDAAEMGDRLRGPAAGLQDGVGLDVESVGQRPAHRHPHDVAAGPLDAVGRRLAPIVIDADDCGAAAAAHSRPAAP